MKTLCFLLAAAELLGSAESLRRLATETRSSTSSSRRLEEFERIVGYPTTTQVTDIAALDLDQKAMEEELSGIPEPPDLFTQAAYAFASHLRGQ